MTQQERNELGLILNNLCNYYSRQSNPATIAMFIEDLENFPLGQIQMAIKKYRQDPKNKTFPLPAQLIDILNPSVNPKNEAIEMASKILESISTFGYPNEEKAKEYLGEYGWQIVKRWGGWDYLCKNLGVTIQISTFQAQTRDMAISLYERNVQGLGGTMPQLPNARQFNELVNNSVKDINSIASPKNEMSDTELNARKNLLLKQAEELK